MWFVGGQKQEYSAEMTIKAPASRVFRYLTDPELVKKWSSEIVEIELYEGEQSSLGAIADVVVESQGRQIGMKQEVIKFEQDEMISLQRSNDVMMTTSIFRLSGNGERTSLNYRVKESRLGLNRVTGFFFGTDRQAIVQSEIHQLKQLVESEIDQDLGTLPDVMFRLNPLPVNAKEVNGENENNEEEKNDDKVDSREEVTNSESKPVHQNQPERVFDDQ